MLMLNVYLVCFDCYSVRQMKSFELFLRGSFKLLLQISEELMNYMIQLKGLLSSWVKHQSLSWPRHVNWNVLTLALTCTTDLDSMDRTEETAIMVELPSRPHFECQSPLYKCLDAEQFLNVMSIVFSISCDDSETMFWFAPRLNWVISKVPCACLRLDICLVWIHFQVFPTVLHCKLDAVYDRCPAYVTASPTILDLITQMMHTNQRSKFVVVFLFCLVFVAALLKSTVDNWFWFLFGELSAAKWIYKISLNVRSLYSSMSTDFCCYDNWYKRYRTLINSHNYFNWSAYN